MKKRNLFWLALMVLSMLSTLMFAEFAGGTGTQDDPWQIATAEHLDNVRNYLGPDHQNKHFIQTADIDLGVPPWNEGEGWVPIGEANYQLIFRGDYNGNGHVISGLYINRPVDSCQGLFGYITSGTIQNLGLEDIDVTGRNDTGGLVGYSSITTVSYCFVTGNVNGNNGTGGLAGACNSISNCHSAVNVSGANNTGGLAGYGYDISFCHSTGEVSGNTQVGGLVGYSQTINDSYSTANVSGDYKVGGLAGINWVTIRFCNSSGTVSGNNDVGGLAGSNEGKIWHSYSIGNVAGEERVGGLLGSSYGFFINCYSSGDVTGISKVGGLVGVNSGPIKNCYSSGDVTGTSVVGGLVGVNLDNTVQDCFSIGSVTGDVETGGLVGRFESGFIIHSYWNLDTSGQDTSSGGEGRLTAQMLYPHSDDTVMYWDWVYWGPDVDFTKNNGYPYLRVFHDEVGNDDLIAPLPKSSISAFPQPAFKAPTVSIKSEVAGELSYSIYNIRGQKVYSTKLGNSGKEHSFELPGKAWKLLSNGVYLLSLERGSQRIASSRLVVLK
ncbi:MAG: GLUG motif-containing protein [Candidatus Cloacimonadaceae bacterium]|jgi:hypothetical protein|nr:T9SS type A sorting domain-containing protein [Candidatus Cloacimonadota bacterium]MDX9949410.1 GLUG motif-containing protein [Candidatus Syntrophosphaera sp.]